MTDRPTTTPRTTRKMTRIRTTLMGSALLVALGQPLAAQTPGTTPAPAAPAAGAHAGHAMPATAAAGSDAAYAAAMARMHEAMMLDYSGDADVDFVRGMIPHHQGAIDMARIQLEHGRDPALRALSERIIAAQEAEIAEMQAWLKAHAPAHAAEGSAAARPAEAPKPSPAGTPAPSPAGTPAPSPDGTPAPKPAD